VLLAIREGAYEPQVGLATGWILDENRERRQLPLSPTFDGVMSPDLFAQTLVRYLSLSIDEALASKNFLPERSRFSTVGSASDDFRR